MINFDICLIADAFDVYNIETALPVIDLEAIETHLMAAKEEEQKVSLKFHPRARHITAPINKREPRKLGSCQDVKRYRMREKTFPRLDFYARRCLMDGSRAGSRWTDAYRHDSNDATDSRRIHRT